MDAVEARSFALAAFLAAGLVLALVVAPSQHRESIPTRPILSESEAVLAVENYVNSTIRGYAGFEIPVNNGERYAPVTPEIVKPGIGLPLIYFHPNGTEYFINSTTHQITDSCETFIHRCTVHSFSNSTNGRLAYFVDSQVLSNYSFAGGQQKCNLSSVFTFVDANTGAILESNLNSYRTIDNGMMKECFANGGS